MVLRVLRFTRSERAVHWLTAGAFVSLLASGLLVGRSGSFHNLMYGWHLISAAALVGGILLGIAAGNRRALGGAASELVRLTADDRRWLARAPAHLLAGDPEPSTGRFNGGQKLNFLLVCLLFAMLFLTGIDTIVEGTHHILVFAGHKLATIAACGLVGAHMNGGREPRHPQRPARHRHGRGRSCVGGQALSAVDRRATRPREHSAGSRPQQGLPWPTDPRRAGERPLGFQAPLGGDQQMTGATQTGARRRGDASSDA